MEKEKLILTEHIRNRGFIQDSDSSEILKNDEMPQGDFFEYMKRMSIYILKNNAHTIKFLLTS